MPILLYLCTTSNKTHPIYCPFSVVAPKDNFLRKMNVNCSSITKPRLHRFNADVGVIVRIHVNALDAMLVNKVHTWFVRTSNCV